MPMEKVSFEFPDPDKDTSKDVNVREDGTTEIIVEGRRDALSDVKEAPEPEVKAEEKEELAIEVVNDTPPRDRNRKASGAPDEVTDDELQGYSEKVRKRIQHFSKGYHDQRRNAEQANRDKVELEAMTSRLVEENRRLKGTVSENQKVMLDQAKKDVTRDLAVAKAKFKRAYDAGVSDDVVSAQEAMTTAKLKADRLDNLKLPALQDQESGVQAELTAPVVVDERAVQWQKNNAWFGQDDEMTSFALGLHQKLVKQGVNPRSDDYYEKINSRVRQIFPDQFTDGDDDQEDEKPRRKANVVAPATRSTAPRKIVLTQTQVALAKRLGVPLQDYAEQVAMEMRKQNG